jgi:hypothetical protein
MIDAAIIAIAIESTKLKVDEPTRLRYAADIAATAPDLETGIAMVATIKAEAEADPTRFERCICRGAECDHGRASSIYQLHPERMQGHEKAEVCADNRLASKLAADFLSHLRRVTGSWAAAFTRFVGCRTRACAELRGRDVQFFRLLANARRGTP